MTVILRLQGALAVIGAALVMVSGAAAAEEQPPNIIVMITDDQGWADIGYNNAKVYSPNMDKLARAGVILTRHYVTPQCTPTRVALMTGRYPSRFSDAARQASNDPVFPLGTPTLASMLKQRGYKTYLAGKWHLGSRPGYGPNNFGFDSSYGSLAGAVGMYDHRYRIGHPDTWHRDHEIIEGFEDGLHVTDLVADETIRAINEKEDAPFFIYVPFHAVHTPLDERGRFVDRPTQRDPENPSRWLNEDDIPWFNDPAGLIQQEADPEKRLFLATVHHLDQAIGRIVAALEESGEMENTLILFSSDNGPQVNWAGNAYPDDLELTDFNQPLPMRGSKKDVYEGGIHVPGFITWPAKLKPRTTDEIVHIIDWFPLLARVSGYEATTNMYWDGVDIWPTISEGRELAPRDLYWAWGRVADRWAIRYENWKIVKYGEAAPKDAAEWELYDLDVDPRESRDVSGEFPAVLSQMHERYKHHRAKDITFGYRQD